jgi:hypothetical protein
MAPRTTKKGRADKLRPAAEAWRAEIEATYDLTATGRVLVLEAARCMSLIEEARESRAGLVQEGRYQDTERVSPWLTAEKSARADLLRCLKALHLDQEAS